MAEHGEAYANAACSRAELSIAEMLTFGAPHGLRRSGCELGNVMPGSRTCSDVTVGHVVCPFPGTSEYCNTKPAPLADTTTGTGPVANAGPSPRWLTTTRTTPEPPMKTTLG